MNIPFFSLKRQWDSIKSDIDSTVQEIFETQHYIGSSHVEQFEQELGAYTHAQHAVACNSGTDALWLALKVLNLQPESIVLTTPFSFIASSSEIVAHGGIPVFIDIEPDSFNISPANINEWLKTNASINNGVTIHKATGAPIVGIVAVNLFGLCADYCQIRTITDEWNLWLVEDAAQSIGALYKNKNSGTLGDISCFSFYPTKNLGACGDAGSATTQNEHYAQHLKRLRNHGRHSHYNYLHYGINSRMDALQAGILRKKLIHLDAFTQRRIKIAACYEKQLSELPFIVTPTTTIDGTHVFHQYSIQVVDKFGICYRDQLMKHLEHNGIQTRIFYPETLNTIPYLNKNKCYSTQTPIAHNLRQTILALPIWPELTSDEVMYICKTIKNMPYTVPNTYK